MAIYISKKTTITSTNEIFKGSNPENYVPNYKPNYTPTYNPSYKPNYYGDYHPKIEP